MNPLNALLKLALAFYCSFKTAISMQGVAPMVLDPTMKDASILNRLTMENEVFKSHWQWITQKFLPDNSAATGFPPPVFNVGSVLPLVSSVISALPGGAIAAPIVSSVAQALGMNAATPAVKK